MANATRQALGFVNMYVLPRGTWVFSRRPCLPSLVFGPLPFSSLLSLPRAPSLSERKGCQLVKLTILQFCPVQARHVWRRGKEMRQDIYAFPCLAAIEGSRPADVSVGQLGIYDDSY